MKNKTDKQIYDITNNIIDFLNPLSTKDKLKVVSNLYFSLKQAIKVKHGKRYKK